eukprot:774153-Karenia_brevis.AAC.1
MFCARTLARPPLELQNIWKIVTFASHTEVHPKLIFCARAVAPPLLELQNIWKFVTLVSHAK